jgi:exopolysaccharide biosynthesis WecB/TagA/CpsF family protein
MPTENPLEANVRRVGPLDIRTETGAALIKTLLEGNKAARTTRVAFANTHLLYCALQEPGLRDALRDFYLLNDGVGMHLLARLAVGEGFSENHNGTDFIPRLLDATPGDARIFLVGGTDLVVRAAAAQISALYPHLTVCGFHDGYAPTLHGDELIAHIQATHADIILVALGNPLQEHWIRHCAARLDHGVFVAVGALFNFLAKEKPRAPMFLRKARLEWLFRLSLEPRRLLRRYTIEIAVVTWAVAMQRLRPPPTHLH